MCLTLALSLAAWATDGFQSLASRGGRDLKPFVWGIMIQSLVVVVLFSVPKVAAIASDRRPVELFGRGAVCGLMVAMLWAGLFLLRWLFVFLEFEYEVSPFLYGMGVLLAAGLALLSVVAEEFLTQNSLALGSMTVLAACWPLTSGREALGCILVASGAALVLTVMLVTGRATIYRHSRLSEMRHSFEVSRDRQPFAFWSAVVGVCGMILAAIVVLVRTLLESR